MNRRERGISVVDREMVEGNIKGLGDSFCGCPDDF